MFYLFLVTSCYSYILNSGKFRVVIILFYIRRITFLGSARDMYFGHIILLTGPGYFRILQLQNKNILLCIWCCWQHFKLCYSLTFISTEYIAWCNRWVMSLTLRTQHFTNVNRLQTSLSSEQIRIRTGQRMGSPAFYNQAACQLIPLSQS